MEAGRERKKKSSKSGGAKKEMGDLRREKGLLEESRDLGFFFLGAGGHVEASGIRNLWPLGVEQQEAAAGEANSSAAAATASEEEGEGDADADSSTSALILEICGF